ncbi:hypothetical protein PV11_03022 [Exophiala sideris]|uniref:DUF6536 domain-containing protein n=1 Tax=Exophiala sideris TaxID=1016849 RepID=A0A0D1Z0Y4_9EURO|nr:hypothetical protein PV11_03022 [Exophiala sideris]
MDSQPKRRIIPQWPPFKQPYQSLDSTENLNLTPVPHTAGSQRSSLPSANKFSPDFHGSTAYTPDPMSETPNPLLRSPSKSSSIRKKSWISQGWKGSSKIALTCAVVVLITNICLTIGIVAAGNKMSEGIYMVYEGSCSLTEEKDTWVHLALNAIATTLLASSNYCMQLLTSPSRREVDKAHAKRRWLDIGIPSIRNLGSLSKKKVVLWWLLGISSIPLHLIYNSVFFSALATNNYSVLYTSPDFINGASYNTSAFPDTNDLNVTDIQSNAKQYDVLDNEDCIKAYAKDFVEARRNVIVVVKDPPANQGSLFKVEDNEFPEVITPKYNAYAWVCDNPNVVKQTDACCENEHGFVPCSKITPKLLNMANQWSTGGFEVDHCLSEPVQSQCHLHFSLDMMAVVLGFNILKVIGIAYVAFRLGESPLVNAGDAIQSFLRNPDRTTEGMCLSSHASVVASSKLGYTAGAMRYDPKQHRFGDAATWKQWTLLLTIFTLVLTGTAVCLALGINNFVGDKTIQNAWAVGLGTVRPGNLVMGWNLPGYGNASIAVSTLIANMPQTIFSFLYICYNSLFTVMFMARELSNLSVTAGRGRKTLRVTDPQGEQKSTYFLSLPYKYGIPLLIGSGLLHWLVSQSIFLANITIIPRDGTVPMQDEITTVAYSPIAMLFILFVGFGLLVFLFATAMRKLPIGMPLIGSNSLAISAACHPPGQLDECEREEMVQHPLNWGAVPGSSKVVDLGISGFELDSPDDDGHNVGHCCFSDQPLEAPVRGKFYA